jgi:predicted Zn-dependent protease
MDNQQTPEKKSHVCALSLDMTGDCMICAIERERDEARELAQQMSESNQVLQAEVRDYRKTAAKTPLSNNEMHLNLVLQEVAKLAKTLKEERDEARQELNDIRLNLGADADGYTLLHAVCAVQNERDEARAVAGELADVASKYLSFLLAVTPSKTNETHEKETMRVIDAIKRWKKL